MIIKYTIHKIFGKIRWQLKCPQCSDRIILDKETFEENSLEITCYHCKANYIVADIKTQGKIIIIKEPNGK